MLPKSVTNPSEYDVKSFMQKLGLAPGSTADGPAPSSLMKGFMALTLETIKDYVASLPALAQQVGPASTAHSWEVEEVGDGNINFVYIITGPDGSICIKQSLPFVRCVGESWPLTMDRARIEVLGLMEAHKYAPNHVPTVYHFDLKNAIIAMQYLAPPFLILRKGMIQGQVYPKLADHVSEFLAQTLFHTSTLKLSTEAYRANVARFTNNELCRLTEQVIFSEPYFAASNNHYNPLIEKEVKAVQSDPEAKAAVALLKVAFIQRAEALLHGDLHTGSIMVTPDESSVIDPEFGFYGPMAFDVAKILGNLLLSFFATFGLEKNAGDSDRSKQRVWILGTIESIWDQFVSKFKSLWEAHGHEGDLYPASVYGASVDGGKAAVEAAQAKFFDDIWQLSLGFMGTFLIRRVVGIAHVADMDTITDESVRGECEKKALLFGRRLLVIGAKELATAKSLVEAASSF
jgi:5-methylthioribose kinase